MLDMAVQLGMSGFVPLECDFSAHRFRHTMVQRWNRVLIESCKQCRQVHCPWIGEPTNLAGLFTNHHEEMADGTCLAVAGDPTGESLAVLNLSHDHEIGTLLLVVGPEGGFSDREKSLMDRQNILKLRLSDQILRTEAAAVALLSAVYQRSWDNNQR